MRWFSERPRGKTSAGSVASSTNERTTDRWLAEMSGPISAPGSRPSATLSLAIRSFIIGISLSAALPTVTSTEIAMQRSPAEP